MKAIQSPTRSRILLLLGTVSLLSVLALLGLQASQQRQIAEAETDRQREFHTQFLRLLDLKGDTQATYTFDYTYWDDMVAFVHTGNLEWARLNIDASLSGYKVNGVWVFTTDFRTVYSATRDLEGATEAFVPLAVDELKARISREPFAHFFVNTDYGLLELRTAPIQPSDDNARKTPAHGYYVSALLWSEDYVRDFGRLLDAEARLLPADALDTPLHEGIAGHLQMLYPLTGWDGQPVAQLLLHSDSSTILRWQRDLRSQLYAFVVLVAAMLALLAVSLRRWVSKPLQLVSQALRSPDDRLLAELEATRTEFQAIAGLIRETHVQRNELIAENQERRQLQGELVRLAKIDPLTGLPNRHLFRERLEQSIVAAERQNARVGVLYIDLDMFKNVNDMLGHAVGDEFLRIIAERLQHCARTEDTVSRVGGDEFLLCLNGVLGHDDLMHVAGRIQLTLAQPLHIDGHETFPAASIGISMYPDHGQDADTLVKHADQAMYRAKQAGRNVCYFFNSELRERNVRRLGIETQLRRVVERGELQMHYQPRVSVSTGNIVSVEALLRWSHPDLGTISPEVFIPIAEETGLIVPLGLWALRAACTQHASWRRAGLDGFSLAVNLSARQLRLKSLADDILAVVRETCIAPQDLELELTESVFVQNPEATAEFMHRLGALGIRFAIDDFGVGYSSLSYLERLPIHTIKIDRSFIRDVESNPAKAKLIAGIISLARGLEIHVVAEGVESAAKLDIVCAYGCDEVQGYFFGAPQPAIDLELSHLRTRQRRRSHLCAVVTAREAPESEPAGKHRGISLASPPGGQCAMIPPHHPQWSIAARPCLKGDTVTLKANCGFSGHMEVDRTVASSPQNHVVGGLRSTHRRPCR